MIRRLPRYLLIGGIGVSSGWMGCSSSDDPESAPTIAASNAVVPVGAESSPTPPGTGASGLDDTPDVVAVVDTPPIPQDPERRRQNDEDLLDWNRRTVVGAYERAGKKDPRWDGLARDALEALARHWSRVTGPVVTSEQVHALVVKAMDAGCDDPMVSYAFARTSNGANYPGVDSIIERHVTAAAALEDSEYPAFRRANALIAAGDMVSTGEGATPERIQEGERFYERVLELIPLSVADDEHHPRTMEAWYDLASQVTYSLGRITGDLPGSFERVEDVLRASRPSRRSGSGSKAGS